MKQIIRHSFALGAAALMFTACQNNEPSNPGQGEFGEAAYLNVSIRDAYDLTRAEGDDTETPKDFMNGTGNEGKINSAYFYFFDADGAYVGQANIWKGGEEQTNGSNIELKGNSVVVLDNLKGNKYPKYMVTVLNGHHWSNSDLYGTSLPQFSRILTNWGEDKENGFVMTTTSYLKGGDSDTSHEDAKYYATVLNESNFARTPDLAKSTPAVTVYVERLAARVTLDSAEYFTVDATVMGADGNNSDLGGETGVAGTPLTVRIDGWYVNGTQAKSYLSKQLGNWTTDTKFEDWSTWNDAKNHRSYWGQSVNYDKLTADLLQYFTFGNATVGKTVGQVAYCNENTSTATNLNVDATASKMLPNQQLMTSIIVKATVGTGTGDSFKSVYLVEHQGTYFTKDRFIAYVLDRLNVNDKLNYFTRTGTNEDEYKYYQVPATAFELAGTNEQVYVQKSKDFPSGTLYALNADGKTYTETTATNLDKDLKDATAGARTRAFNNGQMYYNIPIKHLNTATYNSTGDLTQWYEGTFGVVRNHAYNVKINTIKRLGQGVFNPDEGEIKPDPSPEDPNWYLGATINVLAWKIVNSSVDL